MNYFIDTISGWIVYAVVGFFILVAGIVAAYAQAPSVMGFGWNDLVNMGNETLEAKVRNISVSGSDMRLYSFTPEPGTLCHFVAGTSKGGLACYQVPK